MAAAAAAAAVVGVLLLLNNVLADTLCERNGWRPLMLGEEPAPLPATTSHALWFELVPRAPSLLEETAVAVSTPGSPRFRQYLSAGELREVVAPAPDAVRDVQVWLARLFAQHEVALSAHGDHVLLQPGASTSSLHSLLSLAWGARDDELSESGGVEARAFLPQPRLLQVYEHARSGLRRLGLASLCSAAGLHGRSASSLTPTSLVDLVVPPSLRRHVHAVHGLVELLPVPAAPRPLRPLQPSPPSLRNPYKGIQVDPNVIEKQYNLSGVQGGRSKLSQAVAAFEDAQFRPSDVSAFQAAYHLPNVTVHVLGPNNGGYFGEASLDTQYITASGRGVETWFVAQEAFNMFAWCEMVMNMSKVPSVLSISWGGGESNYPLDHQTSATRCFQKLATQGVSVFAASGDVGTGKQGTLFCQKFDPTWPASSPWVTAVGATYIDDTLHEQGWDYSGGGFSANFARPPWQQQAAEEYLQAHQDSLPPAKLFNASGRATPDVAAVGTNFVVYSGGGSAGTLSGTSASTPTFAGMVSCINDALAAAGKPPVGFVNPTLYTAGAHLGVDVTSGDNRDKPCPKGFVASPGWDPVTGLGTPQYPSLHTILTAA